MLANKKARAAPALLLWCACSQVFAVQLDPLVQLVHQQRYAEAGQAIDARLARNASDPSALAAMVDLRLARAEGGDLAQAQLMAERCVNANPDHSRCAEAQANALQAQARAGGILATLSTAYAIRDALERALRLDPTNYLARVTLMQHYLAMPFFLGGSETRARELASEARRTDPELTRLMRAMCALDDGKMDDAEQQILAADLAEYELVHDSQHDLLLKLATGHLDAGRLARSRRLFDELARRAPRSERGPYGLALVARAEGRLADAAFQLEKAAMIAPHPYIYKTLGEIYEARQDRPRAIAAYQTALAGMPPLARREHEQVAMQLTQLRRP